jgi:hypothetical protein
VIALITSCIKNPSEDIFSGGTGVKDNPYQISNLQDLRTLSENISLWNSHFILTKDIDASQTKSWNEGKGFSPIGYYKAPNHLKNIPFTGSFNGDGHVIKDLYISRDDRHVGLFGFVQHLEDRDNWIENLGVVDCEIINTDSLTDAGGLIGGSKGKVRKCYSIGKLDAQHNCGGLIGGNKGIVKDCYSRCTIFGAVKLGGLVAYNAGIIHNSYATPKFIQGKYTDDVGGLIGYNNEKSKVVQCFWDKEFSEIYHPCGRNIAMNPIKGLNTKEMQTQDIYKGWDFLNTWKIDKTNDGYPSLLYH